MIADVRFRGTKHLSHGQLKQAHLKTRDPSWTPWHEQRVLPALRDLLELPFELVLVSHGEPVHDRAAFEAALRREPHAGD